MQKRQAQSRTHALHDKKKQGETKQPRDTTG